MELPSDINLGIRQLRPEWMDRPDVDMHAHQQALRALARINWLSLSARPFWKSIRKLANSQPGRPWRVLDVACGGGDIAVNLARRAQASGLKISVAGCDLSDTALRLAAERARAAKVDCQFFQFNVLEDVWPADYDVICSSLFLHHLSNAAAEQTLGHMSRAARQQVLISDLVRGQYGYLLARFVSRILTRSPIVHYDGPVSVAGAFTPSELRMMADRAGLSDATIQRIWPARMFLAWSKP